MAERHPRVSCPASANGPARSRSAAPRPAASALLLSVALVACAGGGADASGRYPEEKRPDAPISASDGEVLGAQRQDPADTLEGSLTNEHAAPGSPHAEEPEAESAHERLEQEECLDAVKAASMPAGEVRRKPVCPPRRASEE